MRILILNWRDIHNPAGGGAEVYCHQLASRWVQRGHDVTLFCAAFPGCRSEETLDGVRVVRAGGRYSVYWRAYRYYKSHPKGTFDLVLESINTLPFFTPLYVTEKRRAVFYQLAREVWFYEASFPVSLAGFLLEPLVLRLYRREICVTISRSTREDLIRLGFKTDPPVVSPGLGVSVPPDLPGKDADPILIYVGRLRKSKRVHDIIEAFGIIRDRLPRAGLWIVGSGDPPYEERLRRQAQELGAGGIRFWGRVGEDQKTALLHRSHLMLVASVREGWGIVVMEAAAAGTPSVVYDVAGLRDSVQDGLTGVVVKRNRPADLAREALDVLTSPERRRKLAQAAMERAREFTWDNAADCFLKYILKTNSKFENRNSKQIQNPKFKNQS